MRLSVIMPVHNRETLVGPALRSLLRQRDAADFDIIVIDDGSTDGSAEAVRSMMGENPCIRLFQQRHLQPPRHPLGHLLSFSPTSNMM